MYLNKDQIKEYIPHREPFLFVDEVVQIEKDTRIVAKKTFSDSWDFFRGHFPEYPIVPGVIITESLAQAGGILINFSSRDEIEKGGFSNAFLMSLNNCKFRRPVLPNQEITLDVELLNRRKRILFFKGTAFVDEKKVAEAEISASLV